MHPLTATQPTHQVLALLHRSTLLPDVVTQCALQLFCQPRGTTTWLNYVAHPHGATRYPFLSQLYLWHTPLAHADLVVLAGHLQARNDLGLLELMHNDLAPADGRILGGALGVNRGVQTLRVLFNDIGTEGYRLLCHGLEMNDTLKRVGHAGDTKARSNSPCMAANPAEAGCGTLLARLLALPRPVGM